MIYSVSAISLRYKNGNSKSENDVSHIAMTSSDIKEP